MLYLKRVLELILSTHSQERGSWVLDYRLIRVANEVYKILSKVLDKRFSIVMETLILKLQNAFFKGRQNPRFNLHCK